MLQLIIIIAYFVVMVALGIFSRRQVKNRADFFVAGRKGSLLLITGSLFATIIGGSATVGVAGLGFTLGLAGVWWLWVGSIGLVILGIFFAGKLRKFALYTMPDLIELKYGRLVGMVTSALIVSAWLGVIAGQIIATGKILGALGIGDPVLWMAIFTAVTVFYTAVGGQYADIKTDLAQGIIIFAGTLGGVITLVARGGGIGEFIAAVPASRMAFPVNAQFGWYDLAALTLLVGATYVAGPDMFSRMFSAKDEQTAREHMAPVAGGIVLGGFVGATMSSADSCLLSASTILTNNFIGNIKPDLTEKQVLLISRTGVVVLGVLSLGLALFLKGIISSLMFAYTVFTAGVIPLVIAAFYKEKLKVTSLGALCAVIGGGGTALFAKLNAVKYLDLGALGISVALLLGVSLVQNYLSSRRKTV